MRKIPGENIINHDGKNTKTNYLPEVKYVWLCPPGFGAGGKVPQEYNVDFLVVAGGGSGGTVGGGGGAGGYRTLSTQTVTTATQLQ